MSGWLLGTDTGVVHFPKKNIIVILRKQDNLPDLKNLEETTLAS
jgi:hypothetical protein